MSKKNNVKRVAGSAGKGMIEILMWLSEQTPAVLATTPHTVLKLTLAKKAEQAKRILDELQVEALAADFEKLGRAGSLDGEHGIFISPELLNMTVMVDPDMSNLEPGATLRQVIDELKNQIRRCRVCGCTDDHACNDNGQPCHWVEPDLCSACKGKG